jgi:sec-independent protein translocase protein TatA
MDMSFPHLIVIAVIALIVLGPEKLPQVARMMGKAMAEFRRITGDFRSTVEGEMRELEREVALQDLRKQFPEHVHYDVQQAQENTIKAAETTPHPAEPVPAAIEDTGATETEAAAASGKPSNGEPTPA